MNSNDWKGVFACVYDTNRVLILNTNNNSTFSVGEGVWLDLSTTSVLLSTKAGSYFSLDQIEDVSLGSQMFGMTASEVL